MSQVFPAVNLSSDQNSADDYPYHIMFTPSKQRFFFILLICKICHPTAEETCRRADLTGRPFTRLFAGQTFRSANHEVKPVAACYTTINSH